MQELNRVKEQIVECSRVASKEKYPSLVESVVKKTKYLSRAASGVKKTKYLNLAGSGITTTDPSRIELQKGMPIRVDLSRITKLMCCKKKMRLTRRGSCWERIMSCREKRMCF